MNKVPKGRVIGKAHGKKVILSLEFEKIMKKKFPGMTDKELLEGMRKGVWIKTKKEDILKTEKFNAIEIAKHHRKYCEGEDCVISLFLLEQVCEKAGIKFTKREMRHFV